MKKLKSLVNPFERTGFLVIFSSDKSKKEVLKFSLGFVSLIVLIPSLVTDYYNFDSFLHYTDSGTFLLTKFLIWLILPTICFTIILSISRRTRHWIPFLAQFLLLANIYFYISGNILLGLVAGVFLTAIISYLRDVLAKLFVLPVFASLVVLTVVFFKCFGGISSGEELSIKVRLSTKQQVDAAFFQDIREQGVTQSIYVVLFDELSRNALFADGRVSELFPSFQELAATALYPPRSTTNYDETGRSVETMLSGRLVPPHKSSYNLFTTPMLFDAFPPENIKVWGINAPYCRSLRARGMDAVYCREMGNMDHTCPIVSALRYDLIRLIHVSLVDFPAAIILKALECFETGKTGRNSGYRETLIDYLQLLLNAKYSSLYLDWIPSDLRKLDDFLKSVGTVPNSLYYFHTILPHAPYLADKELNVRSGIKNIAFYWLSSPEEVENVNRNYLKNVQAADTVLGMILERIAKKDPQSIVMVTSDHGVARDPNLPLRRPTGHYIADVVNIPFFIRLPENHPLASKTLSNYQHVDFLPTVLHALGHETGNHFDGISVFKANESPFFFSSKGVTFDKSQTPDGNSS